MEARRTLTFLLAGLAVLVVSAASPAGPTHDVVAWENREVHPLINEEALNLFNTLKMDDQHLKNTSLAGDPTWGLAWDLQDGTNLFLQTVAQRREKSARQWIIDGGFSADEPEGPVSLRHFYDPTNKKEPWITDTHWIFNVATRLRPIGNPGITAIDWAADEQHEPIDEFFVEQNYSWKDAKEYFIQALGDTEPGNENYGKAWRAVGETMHLMADMAVPAHVRNDGHAKELEDPDLVEAGTDAGHILQYGTGDWTTSIKYDQDVLSLMHDLAAWTNKNFLTKDTIPISGKTTTANGRPAFASPTWEGLTADKYGYIWYTVDGTRTRMARESLLYRFGLSKTPAYVLDDGVLKDQQTLVIPTAVRAAEAVIERFLPRFEVEIEVTADASVPDRYSVRGEIVHARNVEWSQRLVVRNGAYVVVDGDKTAVKLQGADDLNEFTTTISAEPGSKVRVSYDLGGYEITSKLVTVEGATPSASPEEPTASPEADTGAWVLKYTDIDFEKYETQFGYPGLACSGGTTAASTETSATTTQSGTCEVTGAVVANGTSQHSWSRPPDRLTPDQEVSVTLTASQSGQCAWQNATEENCRYWTSTRLIVLLADSLRGEPWRESDIVYQGYDSTGMTEEANARDRPTSSFAWKVPDNTRGNKSLVVKFTAGQQNAQHVSTVFWYEWEGP